MNAFSRDRDALTLREIRNHRFGATLSAVEASARRLDQRYALLELMICRLEDAIGAQDKRVQREMADEAQVQAMDGAVACLDEFLPRMAAAISDMEAVQ